MIAEPTKCTKCGAESSAPVLNGLCPQCLETAALATPDGPASPKATIRINTAAARAAGLASEIASTNGAEPVAPVFGDYELIEEIARGGMGVVYRARQISLNRTVAIKTILHGHFTDPEFVRRFRAEAEAAANLRHPNIIAIFEIGEEKGEHFFSMEYVEGRNLASLVREQALPALQAAEYVKIIGEAIHYAHQHDVLHRDLKPSNVLIDTEGRLRISDFGLAKRMSEASELTLSGQILGSPSYMPPEQATGKRGEVGRHSDVYSLGAILYHLTTGRAPFMGETVEDTLMQVLQRDAPPLRLLNPKVPRDLETICLKCLEKDAAKRYASAQDLADDLGRFLAQEPIQARPLGPFGKSVRWCRRKPALAAVGSVAILLLGVVAIGSPIVAYHLNQARLLAQQRELKAVQNAYAADMGVVQHAISQRNYGYALQLLEAHLPTPGHPDLRGWEWRYFWDQCRSEGMTNLTTCNGEVYAVRVSPKGNWVASVDATSVVKVTSVLDGRTVLEIAHAGGPRPAFSTDDRLLAAAIGDRVRFWDLATRAELPPILTGRGVRAIAFDPQLPRLITYGAGKYRVWDLERKAQLTEQDAPVEGKVGYAVLSADAQSLAVSPDNRHVITWKQGLGTNGIIDTKHVPAGGQPVRLGLSPDGKLLACAVAFGSGKEFWIQIWDVASSRQMTNFASHVNYMSSVEFSPDGIYIGSSSYDHTAEVWDTRSWQRVAILKGHQALVDSLSFFPDRPALVTGSTDTTVKLWQFQIAQSSSSLALSKSLTRELISEYLGGASPDHGILVMMQADASGRRSDGTGRLIDAMNLRVLKELSFPWTNITKVAAANGGNLLACVEGQTNLFVWNPRDGLPTRAFAILEEKGLRHLEFSPDSRWLGGSTSEGNFHLWDVRERIELPSWQARATNVATFVFSHDSSRLAFGYKKGAISVLDVPNPGPVLALTGHTLEINHLAFSPDGQRIGSTSWDGTARVWDLPGRREMARFRGSQSSFFRVSFSPDGSRLFVNEWDNAYLFDIQASRQVAQLKTYTPVFLDENTVLGLSENELWHWRPTRLAAIDALE